MLVKTSRTIAAVAVAILLSSTGAAADPTVPAAPVYLHFHSNSTLRTDTAPDVELRLPPGYFLDEPTWDKLDTELKRLQTQETRLAAENRSLKTEAASWQPGWKLITAGVLVGLAGGIYIGLKVSGYPN